MIRTPLIIIALCVILSGCANKATVANTAMLAQGMTEDQVMEILGKPDHVHKNRWTYKLSGTSDPLRERTVPYHVYFNNDGKVTAVGPPR